MKIEGAIFDLDGTLLDSMPFWDNIGAEYLKSKGHNPSENIIDILKSMSLIQAARYFKEKYSIPDGEDEIEKDITGLIEVKYKTKISLKEGVMPFLESLCKSNIRMCVATATHYNLAKAVLERLNAGKFFEFIITCSQVGMGKDNPDFFLSALKLLKTPANKTIVFEDALHAIRSAKAAGLLVAAVYDKSSDNDQEDIKSIADIYINSYEGLGITHIQKSLKQR